MPVNVVPSYAVNVHEHWVEKKVGSGGNLLLFDNTRLPYRIFAMPYVGQVDVGSLS